MGNRLESRTGTHTSGGGAVTGYQCNDLNQYTGITPPTGDPFAPAYVLNAELISYEITKLKL
jgi:hypothetical protein